MNALYTQVGNPDRILHSVVSSSKDLLGTFEADSKLHCEDLKSVIYLFKNSSYKEKANEMLFLATSYREACICIDAGVQLVYSKRVIDTRKMNRIEREMAKLSIAADSDFALAHSKNIIMQALENYPFTSITEAVKLVTSSTDIINDRDAHGFAEWYIEQISNELLSFKTITEAKKPKFIPQSDLKISQIFNQNRLVIDSSSTGFGKTERNIELANQYIAAGKKVGFITHRRTIATAIHNKIPGSTHYLSEVSPAEFAETKCLVVVINSILVTNFAQYLSECDVLFIEEAKQMLDHVSFGECENRKGVLVRLEKLIKNTKTVVLTDADSSNSLVDFVQNSEKKSVIKAKFKHDKSESLDFEELVDDLCFSRKAEHEYAETSGRKITFIKSKSDFSNIKVKMSRLGSAVFDLYQAAKDGKKFMVACDNVKKINGLALKLRKNYGLKVLAITSENALDADQQQFILDPNTAANNWDAVLYSPVIVSTLSLTNPRFPLHFGLFTGVIGASDALQMLRRNRTCEDFRIGVVKNSPSKNIKIEIPGSASYYEKFAATLENAAIYERSIIATALFITAKSLGFSVSVSNSDVKESVGNKIIKEALVAEGEDFEARMLAISYEESLLTEEEEGESHQVDSDRKMRQFISTTLGQQEINVEDVKNFKRGALATHVTNVEMLHKTAASFEKYEEADLHKMTRDKKNMLSKYNFVCEIFATLGINKSDFSGSFTVEQCNELMTNLRTNAKEFNKTGLHAVRALKEGEVLESQTKAVKALLKEFGLETEKAGKKKQTMTYKITKESKELILGCVFRRAMIAAGDGKIPRTATVLHARDTVKTEGVEVEVSNLFVQTQF